MNNNFWINKDKKYIWHPFTQEKIAPNNIPIVKGKKAWLTDAEGNKYLDFISSWWVNTLGHSNKFINKAIAHQIKDLEHCIFAGFTHPKAIELSEKICDQLGGHFSKVFFSDNGSTANEVAIKMAIQYYFNQSKVKPKVIAFNNSYHGDTFGAMSTSSRNEFNAPFQKNLFEVYHIDIPTDENWNTVFKQFKSFVKQKDVAAFVFEPLLQGVAGMQIYKAQYLNEMIEYCKKNEVITIADEVFTGFYRTGTFFAIDQLNVQPDIICLSKGLTAGYLPLGLTVTTSKIYNAFYSTDKLKTFFHGHSYTGNPISCAVACASLEKLGDKKIQNQIRKINQWHQKFSNDFLIHQKQFKNVRIIGTVLAFDFNNNEEGTYFNTAGDILYQFFIKENIILRPLGNTLYFTPPYCITKNDYQIVVNAVIKLSKIT